MTTIFVYCLSSSKWFVCRVNNKAIHKYFRIDDMCDFRLADEIESGVEDE